MLYIIFLNKFKLIINFFILLIYVFLIYVYNLYINVKCFVMLNNDVFNVVINFNIGLMEILEGCFIFFGNCYVDLVVFSIFILELVFFIIVF